MPFIITDNLNFDKEKSNKIHYSLIKAASIGVPEYKFKLQDNRIYIEIPTKLWTTMIETVGRNPQVKKEVDIYGWAGFAAIEAIALYALVVALVILTGK